MRLASVSGALQRSYNYDFAGNSLTTGATTHSYYNNGRMKTARLPVSREIGDIDEELQR